MLNDLFQAGRTYDIHGDYMIIRTKHGDHLTTIRIHKILNFDEMIEDMEAVGMRPYDEPHESIMAAQLRRLVKEDS